MADRCSAAAGGLCLTGRGRWCWPHTHSPRRRECVRGQRPRRQCATVSSPAPPTMQTARWPAVSILCEPSPGQRLAVVLAQQRAALGGNRQAAAASTHCPAAGQSSTGIARQLSGAAQSSPPQIERSRCSLTDTSSPRLLNLPPPSLPQPPLSL